MNTNNYAVIMAGGVGSRFWPMSKEALPKQFLDILGTGQTLIQRTFERLSRIVPPQNIFILTNKDYEHLVKQQLTGVTDHQIVLEPNRRNTAPCILLSSLKIQKENPDATIIIAPSDHWIEDEENFVKDVHKTFKACKDEDLLMTLGIQPDFPNTGFGYIKFDENEESSIRTVKKFTEKPNYKTAKSFLNAGNYLWNAGIFIGQTSSFIKAFEKHLPDLYDLFNQGESALNTSREKVFLDKNYPKAENISIDYGIMEKAENVKVLSASFDWNDLGSWGSLYDKLEKTNENNVVLNSKVYLEDAQDNIIRTSSGKVVVMKGIDNHIVVESDKILLIYPKSEEQDIKRIRKKVRDKFGEEFG